MNVHRCVALFFFLASAGAMVFAFTAQYGFGILPCFLCLMQRWPFVIAIVLSVCALVFDRFSKYFIWLIFLSYSVNCVIALYHTGFQFGYFPDIFLCSESRSWDTPEDVKRALLMPGAGLPSCRTPVASFLGLSMSAWNFIYCSFCIGFGFMLPKLTYNFGWCSGFDKRLR